MGLPVTSLYAGLLALLLVGLALRVAAMRRRGRIVLGDGDDPILRRAIRGHGNATESVPLGLILLALSELAAAPLWALHLYGAVFTLGRALHAWHFSVRGAPMVLRVAGMILTLTPMIVAALGLIGYGLGFWG